MIFREFCRRGFWGGFGLVDLWGYVICYICGMLGFVLGVGRRAIKYSCF